MMTLEDYLALPYTMMVRWSVKDELYVARVKEIEGCTGHGDNEAGALEMLRDNLREWITFCIEAGDPIPTPSDLENLPSGKWLQRVPRSLHKRLIECAEEDGVSLNAFVMGCLSRAAGVADATGGRKEAGTVIRLDASSVLPVSHLATQISSFPSYAMANVSSGEGASLHYLNSMTEVVGKGSERIAPLMLKRGSQYSTFVNLVAGQLPIHCTSNTERISRDEEEKDRNFAYA